MSTIWNFIAFIITVGVLISVHELGHFCIARLCGVYVERFSIGFGKPLWEYTDCNGTKFIISLFPLGGYVKMLDEHERIEPISPDMHRFAFNNKTVIQRSAIIAAGPLANLIFAIFIYWIIFIIGTPSVRPVINEVVLDSIADKAKILPDMEIKKINGVKTPDWQAVRHCLINEINNKDKKIIFSVSLFGSNNLQNKSLDLQNWTFNPQKENIIESLGIIPHGINILPVLKVIKEGSAAQKSGLQVNDKIIKVNGQPIEKWITFVNIIRNSPGKPLMIEVERKNKILHITLIPDKKKISEKIEGIIGVIPQIQSPPNEHIFIKRYGPILSIIESVKKTWKIIETIVQILGRIIIGDISLNNLGGPISIAKEAGISAKFGIIYYFMFLACISVNLGIINLLPIPILDGGHLFFLLIERIKGKSISNRTKEISYRIGLIFLIFLMGLAIFNDFSRL